MFKDYNFFQKIFIHISFYKNKIAIPQKKNYIQNFSLQHVDVTTFITHFYILLDFNIKQIFFLFLNFYFLIHCPTNKNLSLNVRKFSHNLKRVYVVQTIEYSDSHICYIYLYLSSSRDLFKHKTRC